jgi:hypothetical protein
MRGGLKAHSYQLLMKTRPLALILTIGVMTLSLPQLYAAQFAVDLVDWYGTGIAGTVDTSSDTFAINSWVNSTTTPGWAPALTEFPVTLRAFSFTGGGPYDVPDNWDGTISGWAFLLQPPQDNQSTQWQQGTVNTGVASFGWGGFRGYNGYVGAIGGEGGNAVLSYLPTGPDNVMSEGLLGVSITLVPEPSMTLLVLGGGGALYLVRKRR